MKTSMQIYWKKLLKRLHLFSKFVKFKQVNEN